jgi:hypothetical protein
MSKIQGHFSPRPKKRRLGGVVVSVLDTGTFPKAKVLPGRDADHSPPSSAEVENE